MKKPWLALLLSFILPGVGHFYLGEIGKGAFLFIMYFVALFTLQFFIGLILFPLVWLYAMVNSYRLAKESSYASA